MAEIRWSKERDYSDDLSALLAEAGYSDPSLAPTHLRLLAEQAAAGGARSVQAVVQFMRATREEEADQVTGKWGYPNGLPCPTCGRRQFDLGLPPDVERFFISFMRDLVAGLNKKE